MEGMQILLHFKMNLRQRHFLLLYAHSLSFRAQNNSRIMSFLVLIKTNMNCIVKQHLWGEILPHPESLPWNPAHATVSFSHSSSCLQHILQQTQSQAEPYWIGNLGRGSARQSSLQAWSLMRLFSQHKAQWKQRIILPNTHRGLSKVCHWRNSALYQVAKEGEEFTAPSTDWAPFKCTVCSWCGSNPYATKIIWQQQSPLQSNGGSTWH